MLFSVLSRVAALEASGTLATLYPGAFSSHLLPKLAEELHKGTSADLWSALASQRGFLRRALYHHIGTTYLTNCFQGSQMWLEWMVPPNVTGISAVCKLCQLFQHIPALSRRHCLCYCSISVKQTKVITSNTHQGAGLNETGLGPVHYDCSCTEHWHSKLFKNRYLVIVYIVI